MGYVTKTILATQIVLMRAFPTLKFVDHSASIRQDPVMWNVIAPMILMSGISIVKDVG